MQLELTFYAPVNTLGYGNVTTHLIYELTKAGHHINLFPIGQPSCSPRYESCIVDALRNAQTYYHAADCVKIWHQNDLATFVGRGQHIGFPIFELDTFTDIERHQLFACDKLLTCSHWGLEIYSQNDVVRKDAGVVPLGVDLDVFYPNQSDQRPGPTRFFNCGKWEVRKGHDILIELFNRAFNSTDNVELWMMCDNPFPQAQQQVEEFIKKYKYSKLGNKVKFINRVETDEDVANIMRSMDVGVFPSRAEGWNLEALEMMACGKSVIITDYSAHTEFCTQENSWLVPIQQLETANDGVWFRGQGKWAAIDTDAQDAIIEGMRALHDLRQKGQLFNDAGFKTAKFFTWANSAKKLLENLNVS